MNVDVGLTVEDVHELEDVLLRILPDGCTVWVFGSRARPNPKRGADLDLLIESEAPLAGIHTSLRIAFENSLLPVTVDVVEAHTLRGIFAENVMRERKLLLKT